ncbi:hypothetical protein PDIG_26730 [Penicillium digitatum PHI26]|uniref:Uncharacterized protein n=2 Tax=Penicillium digitatum TaxID=36651 RepID=K9G0C5_PEND2|nr:hypothetical protein PDIP_61180 [Penicillium digitatum Pd1]EKV10272.1 hypothetical protein PDIP_61180 [Penicillium digitatum Pd1]EKV15370.1 hypothetical protein PDIG_26730 [Penicillium digitatum PHI26]
MQYGLNCLLKQGLFLPDNVQQDPHSPCLDFMNIISLPENCLDVGLDTYAFIESHHAEIYRLSTNNTIDLLKSNYLENRKLGAIYLEGGLYPPSELGSIKTNSKNPKILVLNLALSDAIHSKTSEEIV